MKVASYLALLAAVSLAAAPAAAATRSSHSLPTQGVQPRTEAVQPASEEEAGEVQYQRRGFFTGSRAFLVGTAIVGSIVAAALLFGKSKSPR